jgi:competence ComEA-like helix-hairpin-helix protein
MYKNKLSSYFNFSKKERIGTFVLLALILLFTCLPFFYPFFIKEKKYDQSAFEKEIATLKLKQVDSNNKQYKSNQYEENGYQNYYADKPDKFNRQTKAVYFYFDPNTLDLAGWVKLGIREKTATGILKYVSKGGKFYKPEDINKIWGLSDDDKKNLLPFVQIDESRFIKKQEEKNYATSKYEKPVFVKPMIDINAADTSAFIALPGIGSKLAQRIISFRDKLGGFYSINQLSETFGLPDSTFQKIRPRLSLANLSVRQLNINTASTEELKAHPYIRYAVANAVVQYRGQHGIFSSIADLKKIMLITDEIYAKVLPYVKVD